MAGGRPRPAGGPRGRFGRGRLVAVEAGLGGLAAGAAFQGPWGYGLAGVAALVTAGSLLRRGGAWADQ
ncbi:hypothetical protein, partial [Streptomyces mayteni]